MENLALDPRTQQQATASPAGYLVVMTACIDPSTGSAKVVRSDPALRLADYSNGLQFWLTRKDPRLGRILFLENSGYPLDALRKLADEAAHLGKQVEFVSMKCNEIPAGISYGYAELAMLDEGLPQSRLAAESRYMIKATGRLWFPNISKLLDRLPGDYQFAVDTRNNTRFVRSPQRFVSTQLMIFSMDFYRKMLVDIKRQLTPNRALIENLLFDLLMPLAGTNGAILRWPVNVDPCGQAAHWTKDYNAPRQRAINTVRAIGRRILPGWWM